VQTVLVLIAMGAICAVAVASSPPPKAVQTAAETGAVALGDDDRGAALFDVSDLGPGRTVVRCLGIEYAGDHPGDIRLTATSSGEPLAGHLHLQVDAGRGGTFGDCTGFEGKPVFAGTLAELSRGHVDYGSGVPALRAHRKQIATLRFSAWIDDDAPQRETAMMRFELEARPAASGGTSDGRAGTDASRAAPGDDETLAHPPGSGKAAAPSPGGRVPPLESRRQPGRSGVSGPEHARPRTSGGHDGNASGGPRDVHRPGGHGRTAPAPHERSFLRRLLDGVVGAGTAVAKRSPFPLALVLMALIYLAVQDRIDRRDPKLALAAVYADPDLPFLDAPEAPQ
jgi:hypothetical protein